MPNLMHPVHPPLSHTCAWYAQSTGQVQLEKAFADFVVVHESDGSGSLLKYHNEDGQKYLCRVRCRVVRCQEWLVSVQHAPAPLCAVATCVSKGMRRGAV